MARIVAAFGASHAPMMISARESAPQAQRERFFAGLEQATDRVRAARAQAVVLISNEHFTNFFLENFPQHCVGLGAVHTGPTEPWLGIAHNSPVPGSPDLAMAITRQLLGDGFEPAFSHQLRLDHGVMTVYHAIAPQLDLPLVPILQNCAVAPMLSLRAAHAFGQGLARAIAACEAVERVAVVAAGGLSHWVGTERVGDIDQEFDRWFLDRLARNRFEDVLDLPDEELEQAGNGAHEIRSWLTLAGLADRPAEVLAYEPIREWITGMAVAHYDLRQP
ncbi:DODA-type extradiol aromatic ring-opening family dioxygenase [Kitasatospora kifunensis]|uniref:Aromatic ring-opening dioxygenase catalytic subunit (LigB family) n=1 Tax=Kitasatospora kifunensis TaxID=58351 RepID=A0A7W7VYH5_KITKI|nr:hypothetical protein [Kitasatospora kifunensis]MBB4927702.1 aromatic ring-opening dioxygenase catalytic subunit (LigB family) [Kitasatospora kifunensis]